MGHLQLHTWPLHLKLMPATSLSYIMRKQETIHLTVGIFHLQLKKLLLNWLFDLNVMHTYHSKLQLSQSVQPRHFWRCWSSWCTWSASLRLYNNDTQFIKLHLLVTSITNTTIGSNNLFINIKYTHNLLALSSFYVFNLCDYIMKCVIL